MVHAPGATASKPAALAIAPAALRIRVEEGARQCQSPGSAKRRRLQPAGNRSAEDAMRSAILATALLSLAAGAHAQEDTTFFITSVGLGNGADLGGVEGADAYCQQLADAIGAGGHTWRAYLSTQAGGGAPAVDARDRIGQGPWQNAAGIVIATDLVVLHSDGNNLDKSTALNERGEQLNGRGDSPNRHDT
jgi:hypothetical protein